MVITVIAVTMMQPAIDQVVEVIAVRHQWMLTAVVAALAGYRMTPVWIDRADGDDVLVIVVVMRMVQVPIVQVVDMAIVQNAQVPALCAVHMRMVFVDMMRHGMLPSWFVNFGSAGAPI
jgi:hypothetical protein